MRNLIWACALRPAAITLTALAVSGLPNIVEAADVYAFAQQKVYGMTLSATAGSTAVLVGDATLGFDIKSHTSAATSGSPGVVAFNGGIDALQSQIGTSVVENYRGALPSGYSIPDQSNVLLQAVPTPWGPANVGTSTPTPGLGMPSASDFLTAPNSAARSDVYYNPNPDVGSAPGSGTSPGTIPFNGDNIPIANLFANPSPPGTDTASMSSVAEAVLHNEGGINSAVSDWVLSGGFKIVDSGNLKASVMFNFNLIERLVAYNDDPKTGITSATNTLAFDVMYDSGPNKGLSVFSGPFGQNPSSSRTISFTKPNAETYNYATAFASSLYPGPTVVNFMTGALDQGDYLFTIRGSSAVYVHAPEPSTYILMGFSTATIGVVAYRRKQKTATLAQA